MAHFNIEILLCKAKASIVTFCHGSPRGEYLTKDGQKRRLVPVISVSSNVFKEKPKVSGIYLSL